MAKHDTFGDTLLGALVWTIAGTLFGGLFTAALASFAVIFDAKTVAWIPAAALAGMVTASFFGSIRSATLGAMMGVLSGLAYLMITDSAQHPMPILVISFAAAVGLAYVMPGSALFKTHPLGQAASGLIAGLGAGVLMSLSGPMLGTLGANWQAAIAVALVGLLYVVTSRLLIRRCNDRVTKIGGPLVSGVIAATVSAAIWLLINTAPAIDGTVHAPRFAEVFTEVPAGALGAALGGALGGILFSLLGIKVGEYTV